MTTSEPVRSSPNSSSSSASARKTSPLASTAPSAGADSESLRGAGLPSRKFDGLPQSPLPPLPPPNTLASAGANLKTGSSPGGLAGLLSRLTSSAIGSSVTSTSVASLNWQKIDKQRVAELDQVEGDNQEGEENIVEESKCSGEDLAVSELKTNGEEGGEAEHSLSRLCYHFATNGDKSRSVSKLECRNCIRAYEQLALINCDFAFFGRYLYCLQNLYPNRCNKMVHFKISFQHISRSMNKYFLYISFFLVCFTNY
ncbi:unnamed protein product [Protopolystoma xenopodis]|uniref:Uncharacterized protein n=1 Tax=Protopolystoma xenopodis TaxID=117903 RepID=A0A448WJM0_9PLAT|nr:unnamed protein product [Protopolystoma xenopodis]